MKLLKIAALTGSGILVLSGLGIWLLVDAFTISESELLRTPEGALYVESGSPLDRFLEDCKPDPALPSLREESFVQNGYLRRFYVSMPPRLAENAALVVVLHGSGSSAEQVYDLLGASFTSLSERDGFVVIYAEGFGGGWNDLRTRSPHIAKKLDLDDVAYLRSVIEWASSNLAIDSRNTFFFGLSNGAQMILRVLVEAPELLTAAAVVGGNLPQNSEYADQYRRLEARPVMFVNGTADNVVPYQGGEVKILMLFNFGYVFSTNETVKHWVQAANLERPPRVQHIDTEDDGTSIDLYRWSEPGKPEMRAYRVNGGKHTIPMPVTGGKCDELISTSHDMNTIEEAWKFFEASKRPANSM